MLNYFKDLKTNPEKLILVVLASMLIIYKGASISWQFVKEKAAESVLKEKYELEIKYIAEIEQQEAENEALKAQLDEVLAKDYKIVDEIKKTSTKRKEELTTYTNKQKVYEKTGIKLNATVDYTVKSIDSLRAAAEAARTKRLAKGGKKLE